MDSNWTLKKIAHPVAVPEEHLDLTHLLRPAAGNRTAEGLQEGEVPMPPTPPSGSQQQTETASVSVPDQDIVAQLISMGFSENGSKRAALATENSSADVSELEGGLVGWGW